MHNIEQFCDKIDSIKKMADDLRKTPPSDLEVKNKIELIQLDCSLVARGKVDLTYDEWLTAKKNKVNLMQPNMEEIQKVIKKVKKDGL
jgi:hypothetical protein|tara:strand:+ start:1198 stop:1461 length:264 start_codon:yes stop_codon:yes gene_type:complete